MSGNGQFGFDPEDFERVAREAGDGIRDMLGQAMKKANQSGVDVPWAGLFGAAPGKATAPEPETTGQKGDGVWAIYTVDETGTAGVDQVFATELDALRAHRDNVDPSRKVRFLPYGVSVGILSAGTDLPTEE
ncbi:hypothetical protein ASG56_14375 [Rhodococcus sp. Leaf7]|uniref:hypothetical protein n=1 Tax=unclassified Rhodococcus (in: high G+C Gram-positive bacteria) TaxID=192944 RepID=UPI0005AC5727|nr:MULTISPECIES: hypothetical protein [unclassified Rhodococcus (in: high G+C Gram-positive bacteria)]KIQ11020.1 hypothetical protein RU01_20080 [Rhodococcus sp. MEB064]KQU04518.1 hypothetical protein ASG56_14375 [Rhodococcus sp. Leaf7]KQU40703.1 hypothetical protein ASG64_14365 [Rhodococcus sp. Leaf247]